MFAPLSSPSSKPLSALTLSRSLLRRAEIIKPRGRIFITGPVANDKTKPGRIDSCQQDAINLSRSGNRRKLADLETLLDLLPVESCRGTDQLRLAQCQSHRRGQARTIVEANQPPRCGQKESADEKAPAPPAGAAENPNAPNHSSSRARTAANTARNISVVSLPVFVFWREQ